MQDPAKSEWTAVCPAEEIPDDEAVRLDVHPPISVFRSNGEIFAVDDTCTHETYSLSEGWVEGCTVECPLHLAKFDLRTGKALTFPAVVPLRCHQVRVDDGVVYVQLPSESESDPST